MRNSSLKADKISVFISISLQTLSVFNHQQLIKKYAISSALNGVGECEGSGCTPLGKHVIDQKIGHNAAVNTVFIAREPSGEIYSQALAEQFPDRDWILTRILWLNGTEAGKNLGKDEQGNLVDTKSRYIYIHGTPDSEPMGIAKSHGCIRMHSIDIIELFDMVEARTPVTIMM